MDRDRLKSLADAWGGDLRRWPESERLAAERWTAEYPDEAARILFDARQTDAALEASRRPSVSAALRDRVLADALTAGLSSRAAAVGPFGWPRAAWLSGAGWAAAACAGVIVGHSLAGQMTADIQADAVLYQASLTGVDDTEVLG